MQYESCVSLLVSGQASFGILSTMGQSGCMTFALLSYVTHYMFKVGVTNLRYDIFTGEKSNLTGSNR